MQCFKMYSCHNELENEWICIHLMTSSGPMIDKKTLENNDRKTVLGQIGQQFLNLSSRCPIR